MNLNLPSNFKLQHAKLLLLISLIAFGGHLCATVYYVSPIGNNGAAGTSWSTAKQSVQNAINLASAGDEVWIRSGTYFPTQDYTGNTAPADNREKTFYIPDGVKVYGGFDGTETQLYQRRNSNYFINPASSYQTILSGDLGTIGNNADNSYHVVTAAMTTGTGITLDGLIIRDGNGNGTGSQTINTLSVARGSGGGIIFISATGTTANWTINNCILLSNNGGTNGGGARFTHGFLKMSNTIFSSNTISGSSTGGGFYYSGSSTAGNGTVTIENSVFVNNTATNAGGGITVATSPQLTIYNSTFYNNSASTIGGAILTSSSATTVALNNSLFYNNLAVGSSTAAAADISIASTTPTINNCFLQLSSGSYTGTLSGCTFGNTNPSFTNTADIDGTDNRYFTSDDGFGLQSGSAAIGAGSNTNLGILTKDLAVNNRVMGTVDVGAYEAAGTGKVRWVNNTGATRPTTITIDAVTQNVYPATYSNVSDAVDAAVSGDIVYVTDGTYRNPNRLISDNCAIAGVLGISGSGGQDLGLYINVSKSNLLITSSTGDFTTSAANLIGYGFNIMPSTNVTIRGFNMDSIRVNAFYNSNGFGYGTTSRVSILKNKIKNTRGHGVKTDDGSTNQNRKFWAINGNWFENIGFFTPSGCSGTLNVTAIWLADAGDTCEIKDNTIINTKWAGFLCTGFGANNLSGSSGSGKLTVSGNKVSKTVDAGIQIGFPLSNFYFPGNAEISGNYITEANTHSELGIGAITMLYSDLKSVKITGNHISNSYNGLAIDIAGWRAKTDTTEVSGNNFCGLVSGSYAVTHKAGYSPNCGPSSGCNTRDDLAKYKFQNNYWGSPCGPKYPSNTGGNGERLRRDSTLNNLGQHMSLNDFNFTPFATSPFTVAAASGASCTPTGNEINIKGNSVSILDGDITPIVGDSTNFGSVATGTKRRFTIENTGATALTISSIVVSGVNSADFTVSGAPSSIAALSSATFTVTFSTASTGARNATITVNNNDCNESVYNYDIQATLLLLPEINVKGNAVGIVDGDITPSTTDSTSFGIVNSVVTRRYLIENTGAGTLTISSVVLGGPNAADFSLGSYPSSIAAGSSDYVYVTFLNISTGTRTSSITINNNDADEAVYNFNIQGEFVPVPEINVKGNNISIFAGDITPSLSDSTDFGTVASGTKRRYTIENTGTAVLNITSSTVTGINATSFSISGMPSSVAAGSSVQFYVTFNPISGGLKVAQINIFNDDANESWYDFRVQATQTVCLVHNTSYNDTMTNTANDSSAFNCANWKSGKTPDSMVNIRIISGAELKIRPGELLKVHDIYIENGGKLLMSGGTLKIYGSLETVQTQAMFTDSGKVIFSGTDTNKIINCIPRIFIAEINKPSGIVWLDGGGLEIKNHINFTKGIVRKSSIGGSVEVMDGGSSSEGNPQSFAACRVQKYGSTDFVFPTGKNDKWARCGIYNFTGTTCGAEYFDEGLGQYDTTTPLDHVSNVEYWDLSPDGGSADVKLYWEDVIYSGIDLGQNDTNLRVAHFNSFTNKWEDMGNASNSFNTNGWILSNNVSDFSPFTLGSLISAIPLPVEFLNFTAKGLNNNSAILNWQTASHTGKSYFEIERSFDGKEFNTIGTMNSNATGVYQYIDNGIKAGTTKAFYRIKQIDENNTSAETQIQQVQFNLQVSGINVYPNPATATININIASLYDGDVADIAVVDALGKVVLKQSTDQSSIEINLSNVSPGIYQLVVNTKTENKTFQLLKN